MSKPGMFVIQAKRVYESEAAWADYIGCAYWPSEDKAIREAVVCVEGDCRRMFRVLSPSAEVVWES